MATAVARCPSCKKALSPHCENNPQCLWMSCENCRSFGYPSEPDKWILRGK